MRAEEIRVDKIIVEPVYDYNDRDDVETLLSRHHPLGSKKAIGRRMSYVASYQGYWLSVLMFDAPVARNHMRESRIGWNGSQVKERKQHIANNSRFLILPKFTGVENLASKILSLVSLRISQDWQKHYGIALLALETYVDPEHNKNTGVCYEAAGWENLGYSSGYQAYGAERTHSKYYFLKALNRDSYAALSSDVPHALLTGIKNVSGVSNNNFVLDAKRIDLKKLQGYLAKIKDPRKKSGQRYEFKAILSLVISAMFSGYTQYRQIADWIRKIPGQDLVRFGMPGDRHPQETTIANLISSIDPTELESVLRQWLLETFDNNKIKTLLLDGKALRGTSNDAVKQECFLNVMIKELGIVINHQPTNKGAGEKATARGVIETDSMFENKLVIADAIQTDKTFIELLEKKTVNIS